MFDEMMVLVEACGEDVEFDGVELLFHDGGYDEDGHEIECGYEHQDAVDALFVWLDEHCDTHVDAYYAIYTFGDDEIRIAYDSMDI